MAENPIPVDEVQDNENSPPLPSIPVSERPSQPPVLMTSPAFGTRIEIVPGYFYRKLFDLCKLLLLCLYFNTNYN